MKYEIIDNALDTINFLQIKNIMLNQNGEIPWYYSASVADLTDNEVYYFTHSFYRFFAPNSKYFNLIEPIINLINIKAVIRAKANFYPSSKNLQIHKFHKDHEYKHNGLVFYVNTNDGYTELEDGTKINSVENRILLFDSSMLHRSTNCTNQHGRITINVNYF